MINISKNKQTVANLRFDIHLRTGFPTRSHFGTHDGPHALNARVTRSWGDGMGANMRIACYGRI